MAVETALRRSVEEKVASAGSSTLRQFSVEINSIVQAEYVSRRMPAVVPAAVAEKRRGIAAQVGVTR